MKEKELWRKIKRIFDRNVKLDESFIENEKTDIPFTLHVYGYCPIEGEIYDGVVPTNIEKERLKQMLPYIYFQVSRDMQCRCNEQLIPVGYSLHSCGWVLTTKKDDKSSKNWFLKGKTVREHPKSRECYTAFLKTTIGKEYSVISIMENHKVKKREKLSHHTGQGQLIFDLPIIDLEKWTKLWKGELKFEDFWKSDFDYVV